MGIEQRIITIQLLEKMNADPEFAKRLGLEIDEIRRTNYEDTTRNIKSNEPRKPVY